MGLGCLEAQSHIVAKLADPRYAVAATATSGESAPGGGRRAEPNRDGGPSNAAGSAGSKTGREARVTPATYRIYPVVTRQCIVGDGNVPPPLAQRLNQMQRIRRNTRRPGESDDAKGVALQDTINK